MYNKNRHTQVNNFTRLEWWIKKNVVIILWTQLLFPTGSRQDDCLVRACVRVPLYRNRLRSRSAVVVLLTAERSRFGYCPSDGGNLSIATHAAAVAPTISKFSLGGAPFRLPARLPFCVRTFEKYITLLLWFLILQRKLWSLP